MSAFTSTADREAAPHEPRIPRAARHSARPRRRTGARVLLYALLIALLVLFVLPLVWAIASSFKQRGDIFSYPPTVIPSPATLADYRSLLAGQPFWSWMLTSAVVAVVSTAASVLFCSLAGFGFAKYRFRGKNVLFGIMFSSLAVPFAVIVVPLFILVAKAHLTTPYFALIVPWVAPAFGIFMMRQYIEQAIPDALMDAARIDGCSEFGIYLRVVLPLLRPALGALAVWSFLNSYNSFIWPLIVTSDPGHYTLPLGIQALFGSEGRQYDLVLAASVLAMIPSLLVFFLLRRQLLEGLTAGAVKS